MVLRGPLSGIRLEGGIGTMMGWPKWVQRPVAWVCLGCLIVALPASAETLEGRPENYVRMVKSLKPGDTLKLQPGVYLHGLSLHNIDGLPGKRITIEGPKSGDPALFLAHRGRNTVSLKNASYITIRNLMLDGQKLDADAVKAEGPSRYAHHITLENLHITNHDGDQQIVGISTKCPAWDWVVRGNVIDGAGTGMYFGQSDGSAPFIGGVIEGNVIRNTIGYNIEIKQQKPRKHVPGMPQNTQVTILRYNVFSKAGGGATGHLARPNVLLGYQPQKGPGRFDRYLVYGNLFYQNPTEALFQATGRVAVYSNLFVNTVGVGRAVMIMRHKGVDPKSVDIFQNTILASDIGIAVWDADRDERQWVAGNAIFARKPTTGRMDRGRNVVGTLSQAGEYLEAPRSPIGKLNLYPRPGKLRRPEIPAGALIGYPDAGKDFAGNPRKVGYAGAYASTGDGHGSTLRIARRSAQ